MKEILQRAYEGALIADAVAMPVHWYYDTSALDRDYGQIQGYLKPKNPHPDSILWRSHYKPISKEADILHGQQKYWGQKGVHYHQFLEAGENTVNFHLAAELYRWVVERESYQRSEWAKHYVKCLRTPGWHRDTYIEEYHRAFFHRLAKGYALENCGIEDIHIGSLATVPALTLALVRIGVEDREEVIRTVCEHVALTHHGREARTSSKALVALLWDLACGVGLEKSLSKHATKWVGLQKLIKWEDRADRSVVGGSYTIACYLPDSFSASLYLAYKYRKNFSAGILANAHCGGDNCHRGAVVGALLGACTEIEDVWRKGLKAA